MSQESFDYFKQHEPQLFEFWADLSFQQQRDLMLDISLIDRSLLDSQKKLLEVPLTSSHNSLDTFDAFDFAGNFEDSKFGEQLIRKGKLGCLLLAGGQGTRLKMQGPKGKYQISVIKNKSLFQLLAEKVKAASRKAERALYLAIMTSPENDAETRSFFTDNDYFGLLPGQVDFFIQGVLPLLDARGKLILEKPGKISVGPDGNGYSLLHFVRSGIWEKWHRQGIEFIHAIPVDNPLADPFDPELVGFHSRRQAAMSLKCTEKTRPEEKVGVLVKFGDHCGVVEYSEISTEEKEARREDGRLKHCCANLGLFCFSMSFIKQMEDNHCRIPLHKAWKTVRCVNREGETEMSKEPIAWKFETFIFDWLEHAPAVAALLAPRDECFAPLKNFSGMDSPETVRDALQKKERRIIKELTGLSPPDFPFEIAADFYYPTPSLLKKWHGKAVTTPYVEP